MTVDQCGILGTNYYGGYTSTLWLTNSLLSGVTGNGNVTLYQTSCQSVTSSAFQTVGAGGNYLATGSVHRNAGSTNLNLQLAAELRQLTTYPPVVVSSVTLNATTMGTTSGSRHRSAGSGLPLQPDRLRSEQRYRRYRRGLDRAAGTVLGTLRTTVWWRARLGMVTVAGGPTQPVRFVHYPAIQERSFAWGSSELGTRLAHRPAPRSGNGQCVAGHRRAFCRVFASGGSWYQCQMHW